MLATMKADQQQFRMNPQASASASVSSRTPTDTQSEMDTKTARADSFLRFRGYTINQHNGQRISKLSHLKLNVEPDSSRCECFIGKIPRKVFEDVILPVFEEAGCVYKFRLMMDFSGTNRGFGFVTYMSPQEAENACRMFAQGIRLLRNEPIKTVVLPSFDNKSLYFRNLPAKCNERELLMYLKANLEDVDSVRLYKPVGDDNRSADVNFKTHKAACDARRLLVPGDIKLYDRTITVDWATPHQRAHSKINQNIKFYRLDHNNNNININNNNNTQGNVYVDDVKFGQDPISAPIQIPVPVLTPTRPKVLLPTPMYASSPSVSPSDSSPPALYPILGAKAEAMLQAPINCAPQRYLILNNINLAKIDPNRLQLIFALNGRFEVFAIHQLGPSSVAIEYPSEVDAAFMLETLIEYPKCFFKLALPNSEVQARLGSDDTIRSSRAPLSSLPSYNY